MTVDISCCALVKQMLEAFDGGHVELNSPDIGDPENGVAMHPWHEEWMHHARAAIDAYREAVDGARVDAFLEAAANVDKLADQWRGCTAAGRNNKQLLRSAADSLRSEVAGIRVALTSTLRTGD
jgi:hypothetical protein